MITGGPDPHLSQIQTSWTLVFEAHRGAADSAAAAQAELMVRYAGSIHRYLLGATRDPDAAEELAQEFAVRFLRGDFHRADAARGRFRDFLKRSVRNLMIDHFRRRRHQPRIGVEGVAEPAAGGDWFWGLDEQFVASWRAELLDRAWAAMARAEAQSGQPLHATLRLRADHPDLRSPKLAELLSARLGRPVSGNYVRQLLFRARDQFVDHLLAEVAGALLEPTPEALEAELIDLSLLEQCRSGLDRYRRRHATP